MVIEIEEETPGKKGSMKKKRSNKLISLAIQRK